MLQPREWETGGGGLNVSPTLMSWKFNPQCSRAERWDLKEGILQEGSGLTAGPVPLPGELAGHRESGSLQGRPGPPRSLLPEDDAAPRPCAGPSASDPPDPQQ